RRSVVTRAPEYREAGRAGAVGLARERVGALDAPLRGGVPTRMATRLAQGHRGDAAVVAQANRELGLRVARQVGRHDVVRAGADRRSHLRLVAGIHAGAADARARTAGAAAGRAPGNAGLAAARRLLQALEVLGAPALLFGALAARVLGRLALLFLGELLLALLLGLALLLE